MKTYISPGSWFALAYPNEWNEFEDEEDSFLFYNPEKWNGNFRISAFKGENNKYAVDCIEYEMQENKSARRVKVGDYDCAYSTENFQENGTWYTSHLWITGKGDLSVECSFTVIKGESFKVAEDIISSLTVRQKGDKPMKAIIPVRVLEINVINEAFDWAVSTIKKQLTKDFTSIEADVANIQKVIESGKFKMDQRNVWESFGVAFGSILVNEMDGMNWVTSINGSHEEPALRYEDSDIVIMPFDIIWSHIKKGEKINLNAEYVRIKQQVEAFIQK